MKTIYKFPLDAVMMTGTMTIELPAGAVPLCAGPDPSGEPCMWVLLDNEGPIVRNYRVHIFGTGHPMPAHDLSYIDSLVDGPFVWHYFGEWL